MPVDVAFVRVLGPVQVVTISGLVLDLPSASQRRLLARLAVDAPRALRVDLLCDVLAVSPGALRTIVSRLRKGFGDTIVVASQGRYRLAAPVDAALFITSLSQVRAGDDRIGTLERARRSMSSRPRTGPNPRRPGWLSCTRRRSRITPSS
jgi:DNA-binding SARP family transcriptional activator